MPYPKKWKPDAFVVDAQVARRLDEIEQAAQRAGVDLGDVWSDARAKVARASDYSSEVNRRREDPDRAASRIAAELVAGTLTLDEAAEQAARIEALAGDRLLGKAIKLTGNAAARAALRDLDAGLDGEQILETARTIAHKAIDDVRKLRPTLDGITSADEATAAGSKTASAWARYVTELLPTFDAAHELVGLLREHHWITPLPIIDAWPPGVALPGRYARPDVIAEPSRQARRAGGAFLDLLDPISDAARPGGPMTADEQAEAVHEVAEAHNAGVAEAEAHAARLRERPQTRQVA